MSAERDLQGEWGSAASPANQRTSPDPMLLVRAGQQATATCLEAGYHCRPAQRAAALGTSRRLSCGQLGGSANLSAGMKALAWRHTC